MSVAENVLAMKHAAPRVAASPAEKRNRALHAVAEALKENRASIFEANGRDLENAKSSNLRKALVGRLKFDDSKLAACVEGLEQLAAMDDPIGHVRLKRQLDEGLVLTGVSVPIGVIGVIFEARPDAMVQIAGLVIKSGNCAVLKGGREAAETNRRLFEIIREAVTAAGLPAEMLMQVSEHAEIDELLKLDGLVDLIIPRGSNAFVRHIMENTKIPVLGHADGICHIYVEGSADFDMAAEIIRDAKTQYPSACNAVETVLVDRRIAASFLPVLQKALSGDGVKLHGDSETAGMIEVSGEPLSEEDYRHEYGDLELAIRIVENEDEAVDHINTYGSHHTDAIITEDDEAAEQFFLLVDSAGVYRNCSTRFADGFRYGFGAEVGISTGKIHARGPVGLEGLTTVSYRIEGNGQCVAPYVHGEKEFHFRDL